MPAPAPVPPSVEIANFNTIEYRRSDGASYHGASTAWARGLSGQGVTVAVIDSGVDADSPEFTGRLHPMSADVAGGGRGFDDIDSDGHGTNVAQLLGGARNDRGTVGIAWGATLLALRADRPGSCLDVNATGGDRGCRFADASIAAGLDRAVSAGARIVNISLGGSAPAQIVLDSVNRATAAGVLIIVSAGNKGESTDPADDPANPDPFAQAVLRSGNGLVIVAGSNNQTGVISAFSNRAGGSASNYLLALGEQICCDYEDGDLRRDVTADGSFVFVLSGTSYSAPQIAGAAALLAQAFPNLTGRQIADLLLTTATDAGSIGTDSVNGRGILNLPRAFAPQGVTTLAGTSVAIPTDRLLGGYSTAMGDASLRSAAPAVMLDGYQRAYQVQLNQLMGSTQSAHTALLPSLAGRIQTVSGGHGTMAFSLSLDSGRPEAGMTLGRANGGHQAQARPLAGSMIVRLSSRLSAGVSMNRGADGLITAMAGRGRAPFLLADTVDSNRHFGLRSSTGSAMRLVMAPGIALMVGAEQGIVDGLQPRGRQYDPALLDSRSHYGRWTVALDQSVASGPLRFDGRLAAVMLTENASVLGARWSALLGGEGASSLLLDGEAAFELRRHWQLGLQWREGWTRAHAGGLIAAGVPIRSRAWALDVARRGVLNQGDRLALRVAQPVRVESGGLWLNVPIGYDYATQMVTRGQVEMPLTPIGREHVVEAAWTTPAWGGALTLNGFWRNEPGHVAAAPDDLGAAVRFSLGF